MPGTVGPVTWPRERWALTALLAVTAALYLWNLAASGYGNTFYAAAAQAGAQSWSAWFFGSLDAHNFITVDKPPAALWVTGLSVRLFGMNAWAVLAPQALMGVASVAALYLAVRRAISDPGQGVAAGLLAGAALACTPAAALMFRFNNPDALLVLLLTTAAYCMMRAVSTASWQWLMAAGAVMGFAFLTKMFQGFLVLPGFLLAYLLFAPTTWMRRLLHLLAATASVIVASGWWVLTVQTVPAAARPYIGGSTDNTVLDLAFGYNGISRIIGRHGPHTSVGDWHGPRLTAFSTTRLGLHRLFTGEMGNEIAWLLLVVVFVLAFGLFLVARRLLDRGERAALTMWGCWFVVTAVVLSYMDGTVHAYYTVALAPAIAALVGLGGVWAWRRRSAWDGRFTLATMIALAATSSAALLYRNHFGVFWPLLLAGLTLIAVVVVVLPQPRMTVTGSAIGLLVGLGGAAAYSVLTAATPHHGTAPLATRSTTAASSWMADEGTNTELAGLLAAAHTPWSAATNGSQSAAALEIASGTSVMAVGGWSTDPVPDLPHFIEDVHTGKVSYYVEAGKGALHGEVIRGPNHSTAHTREIADWVAAHFQGTPIGGSTVYRLTTPAGLPCGRDELEHRPC
jgi:4-amino-4-deoxy-L-arabinose transferase-like glycosyltransferase